MSLPDPAPSPLEALAAAARPRFRTATAFVEQTLREAIVAGTLPGGTPLRQEELAAAFGVSRMPVREALRQLEAQALIDFYPHRGAVVADISAEDAADNAVIRAALEPAALALSLPHLTAEDLARAEDLIAAMDSETDPGRIGQLNLRFHMTLYARAGRPRLLSLIEQHLAAADRYVRFTLAALGRQYLSQDEHRRLIAACAAGDIETARAVLVAHIEAGGRRLQGFLRSP